MAESIISPEDNVKKSDLLEAQGKLQADIARLEGMMKVVAGLVVAVLLLILGQYVV